MRYADKGLKTPAGTPSTKIKHTAAHLEDHLDGVLAPTKPSLLAHLGKFVGRKALAYELGVSDSLLDQMITGQKNDPVIRIQRLIRVAVKFCGAEPALEIAQDLITEVSGKVLTAEQVAALMVLAKVLK